MLRQLAYDSIKFWKRHVPSRVFAVTGTFLLTMMLFVPHAVRALDKSEPPMPFQPQVAACGGAEPASPLPASPKMVKPLAGELSVPVHLSRIYFASSENIYAEVRLDGSDGSSLVGGRLVGVDNPPSELRDAPLSQAATPPLRAKTKYTVTFVSLPRCPIYFSGDSGSFTTGAK